jgi:hypothetical protein
MNADLERSISCPHCGASVVYAGMIGMPANAIYQCDGCDRATWVPVAPPPANSADPSTQERQQLVSDKDDGAAD